MTKRIKQTVKGAGDDQVTTLVSLHFLENENWVFTGFTKGTLKKATFELTSGAVIVLEEEES